MIAPRHMRALARSGARSALSERQPLRLNAGEQARVIEALREEYDLLHRGEPNGQAVEAALRIAEAAQ